MRIEAAARLLSVRIVPQSEVYPERDGMNDLATYSPKTYGKQLATNYPGFTVAIRTHADSSAQFIELFMLHEGNPIGFLALTRVALNGHTGKVYEPAVFFTRAYRRMGYAKAMYKWVLNMGTSLVTGTTQSLEAHKLWGSLSDDYDCLVYKNGAITDQADETTKYILLGKGVKKDHLIRQFKLEDWTCYG